MLDGAYTTIEQAQQAAQDDWEEMCRSEGEDASPLVWQSSYEAYMYAVGWDSLHYYIYQHSIS